jgi:hypothetical protein
MLLLYCASLVLTPLVNTREKKKGWGMGGETPLPFFWVELGYIYLIFYLHFAPQSD